MTGLIARKMVQEVGLVLVNSLVKFEQLTGFGCVKVWL
jgi:hypothetical protein